LATLSYPTIITHPASLSHLCMNLQMEKRGIRHRNHHSPLSSSSFSKISVLLTTTLAYAVVAHRHHHPYHHHLHNNHNRQNRRNERSTTIAATPLSPSIAFISSNSQRQSSSSPSSFQRFHHHRHQRSPPTTSLLSRLYSSAPQDSEIDTDAPAATTKKKRGIKSRSEEDDDKEWETLLSAFRMYKAAYGDLKVPIRFVVPAMHPWPEAAWGLKLGQRVATIRSTQRFVASSPSRRTALDSLGFLWRLRTPKLSSPSPSPSPDQEDDAPFEDIYKALEGYRTNIQKDGPLTVPIDFVVPKDGDGVGEWDESIRGLPLGKKMAAVRSSAYLAANPGARDKLKEIGFEFDGKAAANDVRFQRVYRTLVRHKEVFGDLSIAQSYTVPEEGDVEGGADLWSEEMRGLKLGARVNAIRNQGTFVKNNPGRRAMLEELGFEFELKKDRRKTKQSSKTEEEDQEKMETPPPLPPSPVPPPPPPPQPMFQDSLSTSFDVTDDFLQIEPDIDMDMDDVDPPPPQPLELTSSARKRNASKPTWAFEDTDDEQMALLQQRQQQAALDAELEEYRPPKTLDVTLNEAAELAMRVGVIRSYGEGGKRLIKGKIDKRFPWFNDDFGDEFVFEDVVDALKIYHELYGSWKGLHHGNDSENEDFAVPPPPHLDENRENAFGDLDDGRLTPPSKKLSDDFDLTNDLGLTLDSLDSLDGPTEADLSGDGGIDDDDIFGDSKLRELETLSLRHPWPEALSGMRLGHITRRIRDGSLEVGHIPERRAKLDAIGFDWGPPAHFLDVPFEKAMCAMFAYYLIRGDLFVTSDFIVPDDEPWPEVYAGYELGKVVERIRQSQHFFEAYHTEKVRLLRRVEFVWFPELALPLDPNKGEDTWEDTVVEGLGHPFFWINDPDVDMVEGLQADGPTYGRRPVMAGDDEDDDNEEDEEDARNKDWYEYNTVRDYWEEKRGVTASTKRATSRDFPWKPAQWLQLNGFNQLSAEHEARYGKDNSLELIRTIEEFTEGVEVDDDEIIDLLEGEADEDIDDDDNEIEEDDGKMSLDEFNERAGDIFQAMQDDQLRKEAREAGYEFGDDWDAEDIIQMIKDDIDDDNLMEKGEELEEEGSSEPSMAVEGEEEDVKEENFDEELDEDINKGKKVEEDDVDGDNDLEEDNTMGGMQFDEDDFGIEEEDA